jgi:predicted DNA-binding antitoxin AbrB/MazE fold protein
MMKWSVGGHAVTTIKAVYENGVLRPAQPLPLREGETVEVTVSREGSEASVIGEQTVIQRMEAAKSLQELFAAYETLPPPADGYDLCKALNDNRKATGERLLYPELEERGP